MPKGVGVRWVRIGILVLVALFLVLPNDAWAALEDPIFRHGRLEVRALLRAGGAIGYVVIALSIAMVALVVEHVLTIRRGAMIPYGLAEEVHKLVSAGQIVQAYEQAKRYPSFLGYLLQSGLQEAQYGHDAAEKAMEDTAVEQAARLSRRIEYLSLIGVLGPLLGLMGTVWGMIQAFSEFAEKANPQTADFAPGISEALVSTFFGLTLAIPAQTFFAIFRNRIDEFVAEASLLAGHALGPLKKRRP
ncbi:MotA/TolQ/ExbB proton channel family protein [Planctomyces sp. SH-PL14]|uniref:MotA/TolQ/ExbB proton channel family protein n=1 Tax=Planctomyces sp. SH-PL14 TaxID=1632864 RepID=UPI00078EA888|nr:MotA/TolQ/ExbB proton channel family protein [Planctomyces sp. SH-PL14]AMV21389.1 Biopolymer transport protein ExbB [Planctomyces sp. SH-PL14]